MGFWSFITGAGSKVGSGSAEAAPAPDALRNEAKNLGLPVDQLDVKVEGDTVKIGGEVPDQATKEKIILAMGNVQGVAKVEDAITAKKPDPPATMYTVQKGDTLSAIAKQHYGNANKYTAIFEANKPMLKDPDKIYPGQVLRIPPQA